MIDVADVLSAMPRFDSFCSVAQLHALAETLRADAPAFEVEIAGTSAGGLPIHHVRFGTGRLKALFVGFPHPNEPIGGLTVFSLMTLLKQRHPGLVHADIEWHIVPCIDPDGALLNEGWSLKPFSLQSYMRHSHRQEPRDQIDMSFPIRYKRLVFDEPVREARILQALLASLRPDFHYSLHNLIGGGGTFFILTRDIGSDYHEKLYRLLGEHHLRPETNQPLGEWCARFGEGICEQYSTRKISGGAAVRVPSPGWFAAANG
jgi:hypothetical protein